MNQFFNLSAENDMSALAQMTPEETQCSGFDYVPGASVPIERAAEVADWI